MLSFLTNYGVPAAIAFLMLIAGTELSVKHIQIAFRHPQALLRGTLGQLAFLPPMALLINAVSSSDPAISIGILSLALSPGGGISNYYCYLARRSVSLSASITAFGTFLSLITIPLWMSVLQAFGGMDASVRGVPIATIVLQLFVLMILPMAGGMLLRRLFPMQIDAGGQWLRASSLSLVLLILILVIASTHVSALEVAPNLFGATLFILGAMLSGWLSGYRLNVPERDVLVIESGVRNLGVALILGRLLMPSEAFGKLAGFFAWYFATEIVFMLTFARYLNPKER